MRILKWPLAVLLAVILGLAAYVYVQGHPPLDAPAQYVALGSSYAAGPGITQRAEHSPSFCFRSNDNYAHQLARLRGLALRDMSCSGATTGSVLDGLGFALPPQVDGLAPETELVTLTIGGNDIAFVGNLMAYGCGPDTGRLMRLVGCKPRPDDKVEQNLRELPARLDRIAAVVHERSPKARLVMLVYQTVLPPTGTCHALNLSDADADRMRAAAARLKQVTVDAAARNHADLFDAEAATQGHDVCAPQPWMTDRYGVVSLHTTLDGMTAIAQGLDKLLGAR